MKRPRTSAESSGRVAPHGLRAVAVFEGAKGALVLAAGGGLFAVAHHGAQAVAEAIVRDMHLNPARRYPRIFVEMASHLARTDLWLLAVGAVVYAALRFTEAYGLWRARAWAEWLGIVSGAMYIPAEIYELARRATALRAATLVLNVAVVGYLAWVRFTSRDRGSAG
jgi:uncharacterized membrane protein (DUF2068 family)